MTDSISGRLGTILFLFCFLFAGSPVLANPQSSGASVSNSTVSEVSYTVAVNDTATKRFRVTVKAEGVRSSSVSFALPAWSPGWYVLTNAYKNIENVSATDDNGKPLAVTHPNKLTWTVSLPSGSDTTKGKTVTLAYDLLAIDRDPEAVGTGTGSQKDYGFFAPYLDATNGFVPGPASLLYVVNGKEAPCRVTYNVPDGWKIASANTPTDSPNTFTAPNYDVLADQPGELGKFARYDRTINGVPFSVILVNHENKSATRFVEACWKISEAGMRVFASAPFPRYIYHFRFLEKTPAMMGLEHLNSTVISLPLDTLERADMTALSIAAHEYVHAWNVKRIRSQALGPFDYTKEVRVKDLWWLEGVTDYYAPRLLVEAGLATDAYWRAYIGEILSGVQNNPARKNVTLETASLKAWEGRSEGFGGLSYYEKGLLVGMLLDIEMRRLTRNRVGLDDLMKALLKQSEETGRGFSEGEIERLAGQLTGADLKPFFDRALRSTAELDYDTILPAGGLRLNRIPVTVPEFGIDGNSLAFVEDGIRVGTVLPDSPATKAGLQNGDILTAVEGTPVSQLTGAFFGEKQPGDNLRLTIKRNGKVRQLNLKIGRKEETYHELEPVRNASEEQTVIYSAITGKHSAPDKTPGKD